MKLKQLKQLSEKELSDQLRELRFELAKERAASEIGTAKNPGRIRAVRKSIARIQTILKIKSLKAPKPAKPAVAEKKDEAKTKTETKVSTEKKK